MAVVGTPYSVDLSARGGVPPYTWSTSGLPPGLSRAGGSITGTATEISPGTGVWLTVRDAKGQEVSAEVVLPVGNLPMHPGAPPGPDVITVGESRTLTAHVDGLRVQASNDGSAIAFITSEALDPDDTNGTSDVYVWRSDADSISLVGRTSTGTAPPEGSLLYDISDNGHLVAWRGTDSSIAPGAIDATGGAVDLFITDLRDGRTITVSGSISAFYWAEQMSLGFTDNDSELVYQAMVSWATVGTFSYDLNTGRLQVLEPNSGNRYGTHLSPNGRFMLFEADDQGSPGNDPGPPGRDVYRLDRENNSWIRVPRASDLPGMDNYTEYFMGPAVDDDGNVLSYQSGIQQVGYWQPATGDIVTEQINGWPLWTRMSESVSVGVKDGSTGHVLLNDVRIARGPAAGIVWPSWITCSGQERPSASPAGGSQDGRYLVLLVQEACNATTAERLVIQRLD